MCGSIRVEQHVGDPLLQVIPEIHINKNKL